MTTRWAAALALLCACGGQSGPPRHPVAEMSARATAKLGVIDLVVADPLRAERVREVYLRIATVAREFDQARARSLLQARSIAEQRATPEAQAEAADPATLELLLAPPLAQGHTMYERYAALMQQARSLLTADEFDALNRVR